MARNLRREAQEGCLTDDIKDPPPPKILEFPPSPPPQPGSALGPVVSPPPPNRTDIGNAARFAAQHSPIVRYSSALGWLVWDSARWNRDESGAVERLARETIMGIYKEAAECEDSISRRNMASWAQQSESLNRMKAMLELGRSELGVAIHIDAFDRNKWLLNTMSGIVDLKTGNLADHNPEEYLTMLAPTFYYEGAECPRWLTFLDRIMASDLEMIEYIQRIIGYGLTGSTREQVLFMLHGEGANGKSTFLAVIRNILGDYAKNAAPETFMAQTTSGARPDIARLRGARFVTTVETEDNRRLSESLVKQLTGSDTVTTRQLYRDEFEFRPQLKLFIATNHKPIIRGTDAAIWRRIRCVPFEVVIPEGERDMKLEEKLMEESAGILRWAVQGCLQWQDIGLSTPEKVLTATSTYRSENDQLGEFISECCTLDPQERGHSLYAAYHVWCESSGIKYPMTKKTFSEQLQRKGFVLGRDAVGYYYTGIKAN